MIPNILAITARTSVAIAPIIMLIVCAFIFSLIIICLIRVARYFRNAGKEQKLIRMELGKLAEEVHLLRKEQKDGKDGDSSGR